MAASHSTAARLPETSPSELIITIETVIMFILIPIVAISIDVNSLTKQLLRERTFGLAKTDYLFL